MTATLTAPALDLPRRIHGLPGRWTAEAPDATAIVAGGASWTYADLDAKVTAVAQRLRGLGVRPGDRVLLVGENGRALAALLLASSRLDAWAAIVNARLTAREIDAIAAHCQPRRALFLSGVSAEAAAHGERHGAAPEDWPGIDRLYVGPRQDVTPEPVEDDPARQVAVLLYTSGTTGQPKGVMLSHRNLTYVAAGGGAPARIGPGARVYCALPMAHIFGLTSTFLRGLQAGATCLLESRFEAAALAAALARGEITILNGVPAMFARLLDHAERHGITLRTEALRYIACGGAPLDPDLQARVQKALGLVLVNGYGMTETSSTVSRSSPERAVGATNTGEALPHMTVRIVDADGHPVPAGDQGELWLKGPNIMLGYYRDPDATAAALTPDGWLRTGDVAFVDDHGDLHVVDRAKDLLIRSGFNVIPAEVEAVLNAHPGVLLSAVLGVRQRGEDEIVAFVQPAAGSDVDEAALAAHAAAGLAPYKRPRRIVLVDALPASSTGKILKAALRGRAAALLETP